MHLAEQSLNLDRLGYSALAEDALTKVERAHPQEVIRHAAEAITYGLLSVASGLSEVQARREDRS
jgi:hypothetical protein